MRPLDNAISVGDRRAEAGSSESAALTSFGRALDIRGLFRSRFRRDLGLTVFAQIGLLAIGALTGLLSARLLGPQGRGELAALTLWPLTLISLTHLGTNSALVFHVGRHCYGLPEVFTAATMLGVLQAIFVLLLGLAALPLALRSYPPGVERLAIIFLCFAPVVILGGQPTSILQGKLDLAGYNLVRWSRPQPMDWAYWVFFFSVGLAWETWWHASLWGSFWLRFGAMALSVAGKVSALHGTAKRVRACLASAGRPSFRMWPYSLTNASTSSYYPFSFLLDSWACMWCP